MHPILLVFNPMADRGRTGQKASDLRALIERHGGADWQATEYPAHASEVAASAGQHGYHTVAALGGDGTVHEVVNGLMRCPPESRPRLGIVPLGSGNDFAQGVGVELHPEKAVECVFTGQPRTVDVALIRDATGRSEYWDNTCGIGFDAAVNIRSRKIKRLQGFLMYLAATLQGIAFNFEAPHLKVQYDGGALDQPIMMLTLGNGRQQGGGFIITPEAKLDDGLLDFIYIHQISQLRMLQLLPMVMKGTHLKEPDVSSARSARLVVDSDRALPIHIDGELFAPYEADVRHVEIEVVPRALQVLT
jgi:YegS/Rv2252/BmrU family lipid kinase